MGDATWLERKMNWVAVSDNLPPVGRCVLATDGERFRVHEAYRVDNGKWRWADNNSVVAVTHWMELPTPPAQSET